MPNDQELQWELSHFIDRRRAFEYLWSLKDIFCIYSEKTCQLFSNYDLNYSYVGEELIEIVPDRNAWFDTYSYISSSAISASGILLFPGEVFGRDGYFVRLPLKGGQGKTMSLTQAYEQVLSRQENFLPLIMKGDLREFKGKTPYLHLHWLDLDKLEQLSVQQRRGLVDTITTRFDHILDTFAAA